MTNVFLQSIWVSHRSASVEGTGGMQVCLHPWIIVFPFGVEKCRLHEDQIGFPGGLIGDDANGEMAIQERESFFGSGIAIVIGVAILIAIIKRAGIAVTVAIAIPGGVGIAVSFAGSMDRHSSISIPVALRVIAFVHFGVVPSFPGPLGTGDRCVVGGDVRVIGLVDLNSSVEQ